MSNFPGGTFPGGDGSNHSYGMGNNYPPQYSGGYPNAPNQMNPAAYGPPAGGNQYPQQQPYHGQYSDNGMGQGGYATSTGHQVPPPNWAGGHGYDQNNSSAVYAGHPNQQYSQYPQNTNTPGAEGYQQQHQQQYGEPVYAGQNVCDPTAPSQVGEGDRGLLGAVAGSAAGFYGGHKAGHGLIGAIAGAFAGSKLEDHMKRR